MIEKSMPRFFKNEKASIIWLTLAFFILLIPEIFYASVISAPILDKIGLIVFSLCLQLLIFGLFRNHKIFFYLHLPFVLLGPFVLLHIFLFKRWVNAGILFVLFETSINEAREFLSGHEFAIGTYTIITTFLYFFHYKKNLNSWYKQVSESSSGYGSSVTATFFLHRQLQYSAV